MRRKGPRDACPANQFGADRTKRRCLPRVIVRRSEITDPAEALSAERYRADCRIFTYRGSRGFGRAIPCSAVAQQRHKIIRKGLALLRDESVSVVTVGAAPAQTGDPTHAHLHHWQ